MPTLIHDILALIDHGGIVMWPILILSVVATAVIFDRAWFLYNWNTRSSHKAAADMARHLRHGRLDEAKALADASTTPYGALVRAMLAEDKRGEALAAEAVEAQEARVHRGFAFLSTVVAAAPMLGILGTVTGVIHAFRAIAQVGTEAAGAAGEAGAKAASGGGVNLQALSGGIGEALIATATGIGVALIVLVPHNILRGKAERTMSHLETLAQAAMAA